MNVYSKEDARLACFMINLLKKNGACRDGGKCHDLYVETVGSLRKWYKQEDDRRIIEDDPYGYFTLLVRLPDGIEEEDDAEQWFEDEERQVYQPSMYDCTGQAFTIWHKLVKRRGRWYCYHHVGLDI